MVDVKNKRISAYVGRGANDVSVMLHALSVDETAERFPNVINAARQLTSNEQADLADWKLQVLLKDADCGAAPQAAQMKSGITVYGKEKRILVGESVAERSVDDLADGMKFGYNLAQRPQPDTAISCSGLRRAEMIKEALGIGQGG